MDMTPLVLWAYTTTLSLQRGVRELRILVLCTFEYIFME